MKKSIILSINRAILTMALCLAFSFLFAQEHNLKTELLVYIMPDSLELPAYEKGKVTLQNATINSLKLEMVIKNAKATTIARAFPEWTEKEDFVTRDDGKIIKAPPFNRIFTLTFDSEKEAEASIDVLKKSNAVVFAEKNSEPVSFNDEHYIDGTQWYLNNNGNNGGVVGADINAEGAWAIYTGTTNNTIAIIDDGVELTHEDLSGKATGDAAVGISHGTRVAGVAAARANNTHGIRGVDWNAQILSKRVRDANDQFLGDAVAAQKIIDAVNEGADVLNCSWGGLTNSTTLGMAFAYAYKMDKVTVASMGNTAGEHLYYPAGLGNVIAVGATQNNDAHSPWSTTGSHIDVAAPGGIHPENLVDAQDIFSTTLNNAYQYTSGTSFSAPQVSGLASLLEGFNSNLTNDDIRQIIRVSADDINDDGFDNEYGFGRINAGRALEFLQAPHALRQWTATSGSVENNVGLYLMQFLGAPGLASANYFVRRYEVRKTVTFPQNFLDIVGVWGRGVSTNGWSMANPNFGEGFCEVVPGTLTETGVTLRTYVYKVYTVGLQLVGYYPSTTANTTFAYTVLGIPEPTLSGPDLICYSGSTYTIVDPPANTTITWGGTNVAYPNGNTGTSVTVRAASTSTANAGTITASFTVDNTPYIISNTVWVGKPAFTGTISGNISIPLDGTEHYWVNSSDVLEQHLTVYDWDVTSNLDMVSSHYYQQDVYVKGLALGRGSVYFIATNVCGSNQSSLPVRVSNLLFLAITPNPTTGETTLSIESTSEEKTFDENAEWELEVYSQGQLLKEKKTNLKGRSTKIQTAGWKDGVYVVRVKYKEEILTGKLVVK